MYKVYEMYGDLEPWWLLEGWEEDITASKEFASYQEAYSYYEERQQVYRGRLPETKSRKEGMAVFWDRKDQRWCEECNEYLQQYHSVFLLESKKSSSSQEVRSRSLLCSVKRKDQQK